MKIVIFEGLRNRVQHNQILKMGGLLYPHCIRRQKPQLIVTLIKQSQLVVIRTGLKLTKKLSQPPDTN